ncbi:tRNA lysidine(34) synthetase TilS [Gallaecimonas mangrovi]|uniref:tRNA lysidine(34) synthetase TilS n=1 Tax=Gallaecimonas mangrovi TaxID=2291597 RepID=UPI000E20938C|nr:tRNA lysidine(34) synthetase TilS [Gallaecimonas mangrovi]
MQSVLRALDEQLGPRLGGGSVVLALSGGLDSMVLLKGLALWRQQHQRFPLKAVHVHHGLSANADSWAEHCQQQCDQVKVPLSVVRLSLNKGPRQSLEALAREARYRVLESAMQPGDLLLTAHHLDDQAETFLLAARRGAGLEGLCAMPVARPFGPGTLLRPLLQLSRQQLEVAAEGLDWVEDESNLDTRFDRNFLRQELLPKAEARLAGFSQGLARSASLLQQQLPAQTWLIEQALERYVSSDGSLNINAVPADVAPLLIKAWAQHLAVKVSHNLLAEMLAQQSAASDALVRVGPFGRFQGRWYWVPDTLSWQRPVINWQRGGGVSVPAGSDWHCNLPGSKRFHPSDRNKARTLKKLWQEWGIPPWLRATWPVLVSPDGDIIAVAGLALSKDHVSEAGLMPVWQAPPVYQPFLRQPRPASLA